jgi:hypothetical protein
MSLPDTNLITIASSATPATRNTSHLEDIASSMSIHGTTSRVSVRGLLFGYHKTPPTHHTQSGSRSGGARILPEETFMTHHKKCGHPACSCVPAENQMYCSQTCQDAKNLTELVCQCDHPGCTSEALKP